MEDMDLGVYDLLLDDQIYRKALELGDEVLHKEAEVDSYNMGNDAYDHTGNDHVRCADHDNIPNSQIHSMMALV